MIIHSGFVGIDVSKTDLDVFEGGRAQSERVANADDGIANLVERWRGNDVFVLFEATGRYDLRLRRALTAGGIRFARVNPARARDFARAAGFLAKTDTIDARMLAALGQCLTPAPHQQADAIECPDAEIAADIDAHLAWLDARIACWDQAIQRLIAQSDAIATVWRQLQTIPGIGPVAATTLIALMPELGALSPKAAAAMAGLAPFNVDSGQFRGRRRIKGGRKRVRDALYMAAVSACRCHQRFKSFYQRLRSAGKPAKLAIIAVARKLLLTANAILRDKTVFQS